MIYDFSNMKTLILYLMVLFLSMQCYIKADLPPDVDEERDPITCLVGKGKTYSKGNWKHERCPPHSTFCVLTIICK